MVGGKFHVSWTGRLLLSVWGKVSPSKPEQRERERGKTVHVGMILQYRRSSHTVPRIFFIIMDHESCWMSLKMFPQSCLSPTRPPDDNDRWL